MTEAAANHSPDESDAPGVLIVDVLRPMRARAQWVNGMLALGARYAHARLTRRAQSYDREP